MKKLLFIFLLFSLILPTFGQNQDEFKFSLVPRRVAVPSLSGYLKADGTVPLTANWPMGAFTLSQATWQGVAVAAGYGGTGLTSYAVGDILHATGTTTIGKLADVAVGQVLTSGGVGAAPVWSGNPSVASLVLTGTGTLASTLGNTSLTTTLSAASGDEVGFYLPVTVNKAAGNYTAFKINATETSAPGTSDLLMDLQVGTTSKFSVENTGFIAVVAPSGIRNAGRYQFILQGDVSSGDAYSFIAVSSSRELTDTDNSQAWLYLEPNINQSGTAGYQALKINVTETAIGDGTTGANRLITAQVGSVEKWGIDNRGGMMVGLTPDAIMQVGMIAMADAGTDGRYDVNGAGGTLPIGVVGGNSPTVAGTARALAVQGICYVAPAEDVIAVTRGHVCFVDGSDAGYVDDNAALQAAGLNIGIYLNSEAAVAFDGAADVAANGTITLDSDPTGWTVGDPVIYWDSGDTAPAELTTGNVYWIQSKTGADVKLAATRGDAAITLTDGSGTTMYLMRLPKVILKLK